MSSYNENRNRVFEIYGLNPRNSHYNCHHIVTKDDVRFGLVPPDFDIDAMSNLYPMERPEHKLLHKRMELLDLNYQEKTFMPVWKAVIFDPFEIAKQKTALAGPQKS